MCGIVLQTFLNIKVKYKSISTKRLSELLEEKNIKILASILNASTMRIKRLFVTMSAKWKAKWQNAK